MLEKLRNTIRCGAEVGLIRKQEQSCSSDSGLPRYIYTYIHVYSGLITCTYATAHTDMKLCTCHQPRSITTICPPTRIRVNLDPQPSLFRDCSWTLPMTTLQTILRTSTIDGPQLQPNTLRGLTLIPDSVFISSPWFQWIRDSFGERRW